MRHRAQHEMQRRELDAPEFSLPVKLSGAVGFVGSEIAINLIEEVAAPGRQYAIRRGSYLRSCLGRPTVLRCSNEKWLGN